VGNKLFMSQSPDKISHEGEVLDINETFRKNLGKSPKQLFLIILGCIVWSIFFVKFLPSRILASQLSIFIIGLPWMVFLAWCYIIYAEAQTAFWKQLAMKYGWEYTRHRKISKEKALLFQIGHTKMADHGIVGSYNSQPFYIFEYVYVTGKGKTRVAHQFTVFEVKFTGTFPHLYLNCRNDWYANTPSPLSALATIPVPKEFSKQFKLYAPKEYEIETLEIFTPEVFAHLIDSGWKHDMEFVDGELVMYRNGEFTNFTDLDVEVNKIKKFIDILAPRLNRLKLTKIGDLSPTLER
jgi:hypothetical protein